MPGTSLPIGLTIIKLLFFSQLLRISKSYITGIEPRMPLGGRPCPPGSLWPLPLDINQSIHLLTLDPFVFKFSSNLPGNCNILEEAFDRYHNYIFFDPQNGKADENLNKISNLKVKVSQHFCGYPRPEENEKYILSVHPGTSVISAETVWGALRGLETFSQLVFQHATKKTYLINVTYIIDEPEYQYRGIMLDTARHFLPIKILKQNLEAMAFNKLNVFHWHLVDDQSFPLESKIFPNLTTKGAYSPKHIYTQEKIKDIIEFARLRGIRVIPEIDTPGHTNALGRAFPELLTSCYGKGDNYPNTPNFQEHSARENLNPLNRKTFGIMKELFKELKGLFKDPYIHLGMDEVYLGCWISSPQIREFMAKHGWTETSQVEQYYVEKTIANVQELGYNYMIWQDPLEIGVEVDLKTIVQIWKTNVGGTDSTVFIASKKHKMVYSACWYLNYIGYGEDWKKYYACDPRQNLAEEDKQLVIGGEACMWAEYSDATNVISRLWPRASAVAERLWSSNKNSFDTETAQYRLDEQRCRMLRRGIPTAPLINGFCGDSDWDLEEDYIPPVTSRRKFLIPRITNLFQYWGWTATLLSIVLLVGIWMLCIKRFLRNCGGIFHKIKTRFV